MQKLATREEQIMQALWTLEKAFVKEIIELLPEPRPHYNSVSTMVRILEEKGFIDHIAFGKTHQYFPKVSKADYQKEAVGDMLDNVLDNYFDNSPAKLVAHFAKQEKISEEELKEILRMIEKGGSD